ncbi:MAG: OmpA family protein [Bacteroidales bacterium]|nr:OmpA family protein [Bacteroidales bacterium]
MKRLLIIITSILVASTAIAQEKPKIKKSEFLVVPSSEAWKNVKKGNKYYKKGCKKGKVGAYRIAANYYANALDANDSYAPLLYRLGVSEAMISDDRNAMRHLEDAAAMAINVAEDCQYWLAVSEQHLNMFQQAKDDFDECTSQFGKKTKERLSKDVDLRITQCDNGIRLAKAQEMASAQPIKGSVNSNMPEIAPVFCNMDSSLYFGGKRREGNVAKRKRGKDYDPASDIFAARASNGSFDEPKNAGNNINKKKSEFPAFMNLTGGKMFFVKKDKKILFAHKKTINSRWLKPVKLLKKVSSVSFSEDSSMVVYTVWNGNNNRHDIYYSKRLGKKYGNAKSLGEKINTQYDEMWPTFAPGDTVIYFASNGAGSVGGYDIMKTVFREDGWDAPENLGLGVNSGADENYFQLAPGEVRVGYCSSKREGGKGDYDINKVILLIRPQIVFPPIFREFAVEYGRYPSFDTDKPKTDKPERQPDDSTSKLIKRLTEDPSGKIVLNNVFFDTDRSNLRPESYDELNQLAKVFEQFPDLVIEVSGHTDSYGDRGHNVQLSELRANAVRDYLISIGVGEYNVVAKGYGPDQPRDTNATPQGRQNNRRVEAKILKK